uniref:ADP-ribosylation factor n=1 Tax=Arcella intermedia TaxID=1963864 RepID=A0A6B2LLR4_9EUKA|eukprot:TRINITY_DN335_c0_g1_i1.p1 TRINITY_DN335_c0_g1~~TRINITY_DN335_c0_g1_i1.p1  ORF type:complete len:181 (-),score=45.60 TRINITY_DN335_c0_g1_i1:72-614(-)
MGGLFSSLLDLFKDKEARIVMLGLDGAGKSTILYQFKLGEVVTCLPTIGFNVETICYNKFNLTVWDIGGQEKIRPLWQHYYAGSSAIIYVIDSADTERIEESKGELCKLLKEPELQSVPILVLANKQDLPHRLTVAELTQRLSPELQTRVYLIQGTVGVSGEGLYEGLNWLTTVLSSDPH